MHQSFGAFYYYYYTTTGGGATIIGKDLMSHRMKLNINLGCLRQHAFSEGLHSSSAGQRIKQDESATF